MEDYIWSFQMMALAFRAILLVSFGDYFLNDEACVEFVKNYDFVSVSILRCRY